MRSVDWGDVELPDPEPINDPDVREALKTSVKACAEVIVANAAEDSIPDEERRGSDCSVCRSADPACGCPEPDRAFVRRNRFIPGLIGVPRCPSCRGPMSTLYLPRRDTPRSDAPLSAFGGITGCLQCQGGILASVIAAVAQARPMPDLEVPQEGGSQ